MTWPLDDAGDNHTGDLGAYPLGQSRALDSRFILIGTIISANIISQLTSDFVALGVIENALKALIHFQFGRV